MHARTLVPSLALLVGVALPAALHAKEKGMLSVGAKAPSFQTKTHRGGLASLDELRKAGPVVLVFLRGFS